MSLYESHVTVGGGSPEEWAALCEALGIKPLHIELATGDYREQLMCAAVFDGTLEAARAYTFGIEAAAEAHGFLVLRTKMETPLDKASESIAYAYHEAHVKMLLRADEARTLADVADAAGMHLSRNLFQVDVDGLEKWYLTARAYDAYPRVAAVEFGRSFAVASARLPGMRMEMEAVISDSAPEMDTGWAAP